MYLEKVLRIGQDQAKEFLKYNDLDFQAIRNYKKVKANYKNITLYLEVALIDRQISILDFFLEDKYIE